MQVLNFIKLFDMYGNRNLLIFLIFSLALYIAVVVVGDGRNDDNNSQ